MKRYQAVFAGIFLASAMFAATAAAGTIHGTIRKIDSKTHTMVIRTAEGTEHTLHFLEKTAVHGTEVAAQDSWKGLAEGSEVVAHYTAEGSRDTAVEIDKVGEGGLHAVDASVVRVDQGTKTVVVKTADGSEQAFRATDNALADLGKDAKTDTKKSAKVTVYYTQEAGKKVAHFFHSL